MENKISFSVQMTGAINYAMQQNYIPVIRNIILTNNTEETIRDITVKISSEPEFIKPFQTDISQLVPGEPTEISPVKLVLSSEFLFSLTERLNGNIHIEVLSGGEKLAESGRDIISCRSLLRRSLHQITHALMKSRQKPECTLKSGRATRRSPDIRAATPMLSRSR